MTSVPEPPDTRPRGGHRGRADRTPRRIGPRPRARVVPRRSRSAHAHHLRRLRVHRRSGIRRARTAGGGARRHGHRRVRQVLFCASGTIDVDVRLRGAHARLTLDEDRSGGRCSKRASGRSRPMSAPIRRSSSSRTGRTTRRSTRTTTWARTRPSHEPTPGRDPRCRDHGLLGRDPARAPRIRRDRLRPRARADGGRQPVERGQDPPGLHLRGGPHARHGAAPPDRWAALRRTGCANSSTPTSPSM